MNRRKSLGFTLVESAVTLSVAGVLTATALPSLSALQASRQVQDEAALLAGTLRLARSEALRRDELVTVCALQAGAGEPTCDADSPGRTDWSAGWMVFVDRGRRGQLDEGDVRIQVQALPANRVALTGSWPKLSYMGTGVQSGFSTRFNLAARGADPLVVCVAKPGRARVAKGVAC